MASVINTGAVLIIHIQIKYYIKYSAPQSHALPLKNVSNFGCKDIRSYAGYNGDDLVANSIHKKTQHSRNYSFVEGHTSYYIKLNIHVLQQT